MRTLLLKSRILLIIFLILSTSLFAQDQKLTLKDLSNTSLYPEYQQTMSEMQQLQWMKTLDGYSYIKNNVLYSGTVKGKTDKELLTLLDFNKAMLKKGLKELKKLPSFTWIDEVSFKFVTDDQLLAFDTKKNEVYVVCKAKAAAEHAEIEPKNYTVAYTKDNNLYLYKEPEGEVAVTTEKDKGIVCGQAVHRNEFAINKGTFWSPKSNYLAFYRMDQTMVSEYPIINYNEAVAKDEPIK